MRAFNAIIVRVFAINDVSKNKFGQLQSVANFGVMISRANPAELRNNFQQPVTKTAPFSLVQMLELFLPGKYSTLRETSLAGAGSWVPRRSNLGRSARANPNPAYPESNFESFEKLVPRATVLSRKKSQPRAWKDGWGEEREPRNRRPPQGASTREEEPRKTEMRNFPSRVFDYQRADRLFLSRFRSRKLATKKGAREKTGDFRPW